MKKIRDISIHVLPILIMIGLIVLVPNDYILTALYVGIIAVSLYRNRARFELSAFFIGFFFMFASELIFISTGVEVFKRNSLLGLMPVWLPFLWGYGFVVIKRSLDTLYQDELLKDRIAFDKGEGSVLNSLRDLR